MKQIKTIELYMKHNDMMGFMGIDPNGDIIFEKVEGYMPEAGILGGDTTEITIDNETGKIIGWNPITFNELQNKDEED